MYQKFIYIKRYLTVVAVIGGLAGGLLSGCAKGNRSETVKQTAEPVQSEKKDEYWRDTFTIQNPARDGELKIDINAKVLEPKISVASVIEAQGLPVEKVRAKKEDKWGKAKFRNIIAKSVQKDFTEKMLALAGNQSEKFTVEFFTSTWRWSNFEFRPIHDREVAPGKVKSAGHYVWLDTNGPGVDTQYTVGKENFCKISKEEAQEKAEEFLNNLGLGGQGQTLVSSEPLLWDVSDEKEQRFDWENGICCGYTFEYGPVTASGDVIDYENLFSEAFYGYSQWSHQILCVTDDGVIYANLEAPVQILSETTGVSLLPLEKIKECIHNSMEDYMNSFLERGKVLNYYVSGVGEVDQLVIHKFDELELQYCRIKKEDDSNTYSYVPAWRLAYSSDAFTDDLYINAIDGSMIDAWNEVNLDDYEEDTSQLDALKKAVMEDMEQEENE